MKKELKHNRSEIQIFFALGILKKGQSCQALVAYPCNPNYLRDRDREGHGSKPALGK
jgi:hypothetical protein